MVTIESVLGRFTGSLFHRVGAATLKDLPPEDFFSFSVLDVIG